MRIDILTLFPRIFKGPTRESIIGEAREKQLLELGVPNFRDFLDNKHQTVDDYPYGGGVGMFLKVQLTYDNLKAVEEETNQQPKWVVLLDPAGKPFNQEITEEFSQEEHLVFIYGYYGGYDERIRMTVTDEVSLGNYILAGGELDAAIMTDATVHLLSDVLGNNPSARTDSHSTGLSEHP